MILIALPGIWLQNSAICWPTQPSANALGKPAASGQKKNSAGPGLATRPSTSTRRSSRPENAPKPDSAQEPDGLPVGSGFGDRGSAPVTPSKLPNHRALA